MKGFVFAGVLVLILGVLSFIAPFPRTEHHGINIGDAHIGVTTEHDQKVSPVVSVVLVMAGAAIVLAGRKS